MALRNYSSSAAGTTLSSLITNVATTCTVGATTGFPAAPFIAIIDPDTSSEEVVLVTNVAGTTLTITRGYDGSTAIGHNAGAIFQHSFSAIDFREPNTFLNSGGTIGGAVTISTGGLTLTSGNLAVSSGTISASSTISASGLAGSLLSSANPVMNGTAAPGTSAIPSRQDHVHPTDTSRAAVGQTMYIGTTAVAINRTSAALTLAGITLTTPDIGAASGTSLSLSSTISASGLAGSLLSSATPAALGTAAAGTSAIPSRQDHVHSNVNVALTTPTLTQPYIVAPEEKWNISATAIAASTIVDFITAQNWYYTTASTAGACTLNIRGNSGTTLSSLLAVGDSATLVVMATTGATTPGYFGTIQIDGTVTGVTTRWMYGSAPTAGSTSAVDAYSFVVVKTAATPTYTVFASVAKN